MLIETKDLIAACNHMFKILFVVDLVRFLWIRYIS